MELKIKEVSDSLDKVSNSLLSLMEESGMSQVKDLSGRTVFLCKPSVYAQIKGDVIEDALNFLRESWGVQDEIKETIAPATLSRIVKEKLEQGESVPDEFFSYYMKKKLGHRK